MTMMRIQHVLFAAAVGFGLFTLCDAAAAAPKANHHNGKQLLSGKIKTNGTHKIDQKGEYTASVEVRGEKIAGMHVTHAKKGEVAVKKYKTSKKLAMASGPFINAAFGQDENIGTTYIGYSYVNDYGEEEIYWFPYDMILDGDTGAIEYVPAG